MKRPPRSSAVLAVLLAATALSSAQVTLIGSGVRNGDFGTLAAGAADDGDVAFNELEDWTNVVVGGTQSIQAARNTPANLDSTGAYAGASGGYNAVITESDTRFFGNDTGHTVVAGDLFDVSYHWIDAFNWADATDQIALVFYTTDTDQVDGTVEDSVEFLSGTSTANATYEEFSQTGISLPASFENDVLFVQFHGRDGSGTTNGFARLDDFELLVTPAPVDPKLVVDSGNFTFGQLVHPAGTDSSSRTVTFRNDGAANDLTVDDVSLTDDAGGIFSVTMKPAPGTVVGPGGTFEVEVTATGGGGYTDYVGELLIDTTPDGQDTTLEVTATIIGGGDPYFLLENCDFAVGTSGWGGGAATAGLVSPEGLRVRGLGDSSAVAAESVGQGFGYTASPDFNVEVVFAIPDFTAYTGFAPLASVNDRSFHLVLYDDAGVDVSTPVDDGKNSGALIDLFYMPAGNEDDGTPGFYIYDGVAGAFQRLPNLGTLLPSTGLDVGDEPPSVLNVYTLTLTGTGFGTPAASYSISISDPNAATVAGTEPGLTAYHGSDPAQNLAGAVVLTTNDENLDSVTNPDATFGGAGQPSFWVDRLCASLGATVPLALYDLVSPPTGVHFLPGASGEITFTVANVGLGADLDLTAASFGDPSRFSLASPSLPVSIAPGASQEFTVVVDGSGESGSVDLSTTLDLTTNDAIQPSRSLDLSARVIDSGGLVLIDYDDGDPGNGIHDGSIRNGGFEEGLAGQTFVDTPFWTSRFSPEGDGTVLTLDSEPATGLLHGQSTGFSGPGERAQPTQAFTLAEWTLQENDVFEVEMDVKAGANFTDPASVQFIIEVFDADGNLVNDPLNGQGGQQPRLLSESFTITNSGTYETFRAVSPPVPAGSPWIGNRISLRVLKNGARDTFINIDNIHLRGFILVPELEISAFAIDAASGQVTLRWNDAGFPSYTVQGDADLDFSAGVLEIPLDGSEDTTSFPGEIEFTFTDPTGGAMRFWRVSGG